MCSNDTITRVRSNLTKSLLPIDDFRKHTQSTVDIGDLLLPDSDLEFLQVAYRRLLGRSASPACLNNWIGRLADGSLSRVEVLHHLRMSRDGRRHNVEVVGLDQFLLEEQREIPRKRSWLKQVFTRFKTSRCNLEVDRRITNTDRRVASMAANWLEVLESLEYHLRQIKSGVRLGEIPSLINAVATDQFEEADEIRQRVKQMHARMAKMAPPVAATPMEEAICQIRQYADKHPKCVPLDDWLISADIIDDVLRGCQNAGIEIADAETSFSSIGFVRSLGINVKLAASLSDFLDAHAPASSGGVILKSRLADLGDGELIRRLVATSRTLVSGGYLVISESGADLSFFELKIQAALEVCGFTFLNPLSKVQSSDHDDLVIVAQKSIDGEVHCDP